MWKEVLMTFSLLVVARLSFAQKECAFIPPQPQFPRVIEGYEGEYLNLALDNEALPILSFYDTLSGKLYIFHATSEGLWNRREVDSGTDLNNILLFSTHPVIVYAKEREIRVDEDGVNSLISSYGNEIKGLSAEMADGLIISFYLLTANHSEWELRVRKGETEVVLDGGIINEVLKRGDIISALSTAIFVTNTMFRVVYTDLTKGSIKEYLLSSDLQMQGSDEIYYVPTAPFSGQWIKKFSGDDTFGVTFYHSIDSKLMVALNRKGVWSVFAPLGTKTGIGMYPAPIMMNQKLKILGFDSSFGFVSLIEEKDYGFTWKRIDGRGNAGMWCVAIPFSPYDIIFAFSVPLQDKIEVHYLSDY